MALLFRRAPSLRALWDAATLVQGAPFLQQLPALSPHPRCNLGNQSITAKEVPSAADQSADPQVPAAKMEKPVLAPPGLSRTFYKRILPSPPAIEFASAQGKQIFAQAMLAGTMEGFFKLIEQFRTQDEPAYCGLASLAMVLNTLSIDPRRTWKGPWRWFHEEMLDCCHPLSKVREEGITLEQAACLARCNGSKVDVYLYGAVGVEEFRCMVREACSTGTQHIIVSYSRKEFLQTGDGHFSPVGGYSEDHDMVLILDTARFKYPPHWVPLEMLYIAMARLDPMTGKPRGFLRLGTHPRLDSVLFTIDLRDPVWQDALHYVEQGILPVVRDAAVQPDATPASVLRAAAAAAPFHALRQFIAVRTVGSSCNGGVCTQEAAIELFLRELRGMPIYAAVAPAVPPAPQQQPQPQHGAAAAAIASQHGALHSASCCAPAGAALPAADPQHAQHAQQRLPVEQHPLQPPSPTLTSSHAVAAASSAAPAVEDDVTAERVCMLLMMAPQDVWQGIKNDDLRHAVLNMLDTATHKVVGIEAEYLQNQFLELQALQQASAQAATAPAGAACSVQRAAEQAEQAEQRAAGQAELQLEPASATDVLGSALEFELSSQRQGEEAGTAAAGVAARA